MFRRPTVVALLGILALTSLGVAAGEPASGAWSPPTFVRSIGGRGEAGVYAWGITYNPVSDEILVGDYWNYKIRRYDRDGRELGSFYRAPSLRKGQPYSLAVNPVNGDIYVPEISDGNDNGYLARYDSAGNYLGEIHTNARYVAWIHIDANSRLWIADSHYWNDAGDPPKIRSYNATTGQQLSSFGFYSTSVGNGGISNVHGLGTDTAGNIYAADAGNLVVHVYSPGGTWLRDFGGPGSGLGQFTGDLRGLAVDKANGWVYVVDAEGAQIEKFALDGTPLAHWGSEGQGPGQYGDGGRQIAVDGEGHVWAADYGNYRFFEHDSDGNVLGTYPDPAQPPMPGGFSQNRDVAVDPATGAVWAADSWNNRFQKFAADGAFLGTWGSRNSHPPYGMDYPRGVAVDPVSGNIWVSSTRDHFIRVYAPDLTYLMTVGDGEDSSGTGSFRWPMDIEFYNNKAYVSDYSSGRVKIVSPTTGAELQSFSRTNNGVAVDPATGYLFVVSWSNDRVYRYNPGSTSSYITFGSGGSGNGQFRNPWDIDVVNGVVYVSDAELGRVQAFSISGQYLGQWGTKGTKPGQFLNPSGLAHDAAGNIYVADAGNNRVQVFSFGAAPPVGDTTVPTGVVSSPVANSTVPAAATTISGTATDDVGVANVEVAVRNTDAGLWWNANDAVWQPVKVWNITPWWGPVTAPSFSFGLTSVGYSTNYQTHVRVTDLTGNWFSSKLLKFTTDGPGGAPDVVAPTTFVLGPANNSTVPAGTVTISGQAVDDRAVGTTQIGIKDRATNLWWNPATGTWGAFKYITVTTASPGATASTWSWDWAAAPPGSYFVQARTTDAAGNIETTAPPPSTKFTVTP